MSCRAEPGDELDRRHDLVREVEPGKGVPRRDPDLFVNLICIDRRHELTLDAEGEYEEVVHRSRMGCRMRLPQQRQTAGIDIYTYFLFDLSACGRLHIRIIALCSPAWELKS